MDIHPKSVNAGDCFFESPLLLYHTKLKTSCIFLHDTTMVYPFPVVLFANNLKITGEKTDHVTLSLNSQIHFTCSARTANLIKVNKTILLKFLLIHYIKKKFKVKYFLIILI